MPERQRFSLVEIDSEEHLESFADAVRAGLTAAVKSLPCRFFYDEVGSDLFEQICELPEYYLTRAESEILETSAEQIAQCFAEPIALVELGSGSSTKTRLLIEAFLQRHGALSYVPVDISASILESSAFALLDDFEKLEIRAIAGEYQEGLRRLRTVTERPKLIIWLGSTIGNFDRPGAAQFLSGMIGGMGPEDRLLLGIDLRKDREVLERAYNDASGLTSRFNLNLLERINRELGGQFDAEAFEFRADYDEPSGAVESHLRSRKAQTVHIENLALDVHFAAGETIHTESSVKYSFEEIDALAGEVGLTPVERWLDAAERFSLNLFARTTAR